MHLGIAAASKHSQPGFGQEERYQQKASRIPIASEGSGPLGLTQLYIFHMTNMHHT